VKYHRVEMEVHVVGPESTPGVVVAFRGFESVELANFFADFMTDAIKQALSDHGQIVVDGSTERTKQ
jgi:hypothetical protein